MKKSKFFCLLALLLMMAVGAKADGLAVTSADIGKVLCTDGSLYATVTAAVNANKTPVAMIAYIDTQNHTGLAIALDNADYNIPWTDAESTIETWVTNYGYSVANATWKLPTTQEWQKMLIGCGADYSPTNDTFSFTEINSKLSNVQEYSELYGTCWSADSYSDYAETAYFNYDESTVYFYSMSKDEQYVNVRACLAFTVEESASTSGIVVTTNDIGKVLCSDGSLYATVTAATEASKTPVAMIAYIDTQDGTGLAIALNDETSTMAWERATLATMAHKPVVAGGMWKLPTVMEWKQMLIGCGATEEIDEYVISYSQMDAKLTTAEGGILTTGNDCYYWSATVETGEYGQFATNPLFENGQASFGYGSSLGVDYNVRACLSFTLGESSSTNGIVVTSTDVGKVLCTDGSLYATVSAATEASKTPAAMITYVDMSSKKGIAVALADEYAELDPSYQTISWSYALDKAAEHTPTVTNGTWKLPTVVEWKQMFIGCGATGNVDDDEISYSEMDAKLTTAEGTTLNTGSYDYYWTATESIYSSDDAHVLAYDNGQASFSGTYDKGSSAYARACLTFDIADAPEAEPLSLAVTTADVGKVVCTDGSIYDSVTEAEADSRTPAGMIAFVDMDYETGLVIALQDESEYNEQYDYYDTYYNWTNASAAAGAHSPAVSGATWKLPTIDEWRNMLVGCGATIEYVNDNTTTYAEINNTLYNAGASTLEQAFQYNSNWYGGQYWSSTVEEYENNQYAQYAEFKEGDANLSYSTDLYQQKYVRACFTFNVALTKYPITIDDYYASYVTSNKSEAAEGETVGLTISNIPEGKYVSGVYIKKTDEDDGYDSATPSIYDNNVFTFTMPAYPVTVYYVGIEDIQSAQVIDGIYYTFNNMYGTAEVAPHPTNSYSGDITVPATVKPSYRTYYVTSIGQDAFAGYNNNEITSVTLGSNVSTIKRNAFYNTTLTSLTLNEGLTTIEQYAFRDGNYPIAIPSTVNNISTWAFKGYKGTSMSVAAGNGTYDSRGGCNAIIETAENTIVAGCIATTIPNTVTMIGEAAFDGVGLTSIDIPANVTTLDMGAFANNPLTAITIPATVTTIYNNPLYGCNELTSITVADGNPNFDSRDNCNAICDKEKRWVIATCKTTVIPQTITGIGTFAFAYRQDLNEFKVPSHIGIINDNAFAYSNLWNVTLTDNNDLVIGQWAFGQCKELRTVKIGHGIRRIDGQVFMGCSKLSNIYVNAPMIPKVMNTTFVVNDGGDKTTAKVHVPSASLRTYQKANFWKDLTLVASNSVQGVTASFKGIASGTVPASSRAQRRAPGDDVNLSTEEGTVWLATGATSDAFSISTYAGESCLQMATLPVTFSNRSDMGFTISGSVKKIVVRAANVNGITCEIVDISENPDNTTYDQSQTVSPSATSSLCDYTLTFSGKEYEKAKVKVTIAGSSPAYLGNISIVQGGGDYVITEADEITVNGIEYSNTLSAPASAEDAEAIIDGSPVYVYTTCLPTAPQTSAGIKYYTLSGSTSSSLQFVEITGAPQANTPYLVAVSSDTEINLSVSESQSVTLKKESDNTASTGAFRFVGTTVGLTNAEAAAMQAYFLQDGNVWGKVTTEYYEAYLPPFRAYIVPIASGARSTLTGGFDEETTSINTMQLTDNDGTTHYFDLNGRRINKPVAKGVYVVNGKKVLIK